MVDLQKTQPVLKSAKGHKIRFLIALFIALSLGSFLNATLPSPSPLSQETKAPVAPWLTGPLIAPYGTVVPYGDFMVRSYLYFTSNVGAYDHNWEAVPLKYNIYSLNLQFQCFFGLTPWCDLYVAPQFIYNTTSYQSAIHVGDLTVGLDFQLLDATATKYFPGIKFAIREVFPTGNYQLFHARKWLTDQTGMGTFGTQFLLVFYKQFHLNDLHWLSVTLSGQYTINTPVEVFWFNAYGGGFGTQGKAFPGDEFQAIVSFEYTMSQNWALALDTIYSHSNRADFFGRPGITFYGTYATVGKPSSEQLSFAPALEYNFSKNLGIIVGCWLSALGRNSAEFRGVVMNMQYTY